VPVVLSQTPTPWVAADRPCYVAQSPIALHGGGFDPGAVLKVTRDGVLLASPTAADDGTFTASVDSGPIGGGLAESDAELTVSDADTTVVQRVRVSTFGASYAPSSAAPTSFVRFSAFGFGSSHVVYVHYLRPDGSSADTVRLGPTRGACGTIKRTAKRRLFRFTPQPGTWRLQFDTVRQADPGTVPRIVLPVTVR
jgi:hypothetical protein